MQIETRSNGAGFARKPATRVDARGCPATEIAARAPFAPLPRVICAERAVTRSGRAGSIGMTCAARRAMAHPTAHATTTSPPRATPASPEPSRPPDPRQPMVVLSRFGGAEGLARVEQPMPVVGPGDVRVRVLAASVQFTDVIIRKGKYPGLGQKPPLVLGYDVVGEIDEVGPEVSKLAVGDRIADLTVTGSYARYRTLRADRVVRVPPSVDPAEAAALVLSWTTAYQLLHRVAQVVPGKRILVYGASGAVGQALLTLGRLAGLHMWGTCHPPHAALVRSLGATPIDATQHARLLVPEGFDAVFDGIGMRGFADAWACVNQGGILAAFGFSEAVNRNAPGWKLGWWLLRLHVWNWLPNGKRARFYSIVALREQHPA